MQADDAQDRIHNILSEVLLLRNQRVAPEHFVLVVHETLVCLLQLVLAASSCRLCCYSCVA
jgi:hypothetical protein